MAIKTKKIPAPEYQILTKVQKGVKIKIHPTLILHPSSEGLQNDNPSTLSVLNTKSMLRYNNQDTITKQITIFKIRNNGQTTGLWTFLH